MVTLTCGTGTGHRMSIAVVVLAGFLVATVSGDSKAVTTSLTTKWPSTPLLLEARYVWLGNERPENCHLGVLAVFI